MSTSDDQRRRERREIVRRHHPDRGGDPAELVAELGALDRRYDQPEPVAVRASAVVQLRRRVRRASRTARQQVRVVRAAVPRGWPGHRRYHDISTRAPASAPDAHDPTRPSGDTP